jgi:chromate transporter
LNLGIWFSLHTLFAQVGEVSAGPLHIPVPVWNTVEWGAVIITLAALFFSFRLKWDMLRTIGVCMVLGLIFKFFVTI